MTRDRNLFVFFLQKNEVHNNYALLLKKNYIFGGKIQSTHPIVYSWPLWNTWYVQLNYIVGLYCLHAFSITITADC